MRRLLAVADRVLDRLETPEGMALLFGLALGGLSFSVGMFVGYLFR